MIGKETKVGWLNDTFRSLFSLFDKVVFWLLILAYQVFLKVASATIIKPETVKALFGRIQVIFGILIMFKLIMSLIEGIINPDSLTDKEKGFGKIITRVIIALAMIVLIMPVNIPNPTDSYQKQVNTHGILFGTLYEFQTRVINSNTIGKLILGVSGNNTENNGTIDEESMKASANLMASVILKSFMQINLKSHLDEKDAEYDIANWQCDPTRFNGNADEVMQNYTIKNSDPLYLLDNINVECGKYYVFNYTILFGAVVGGILAFIIIGFTVDVALRSIKLAILRLIAPVPIISYIDPKSEKDGAFGAWVKTLTSTYLDLFLRLMIIYFAIFIVDEIANNGSIIEFGDNSMVNTLAIVFIFIGVFMFAKQAPDFIKQMFGIKGDSKGSFSGLGKMLGLGAVTAVGGAAALGGKKLIAGADSAFHGKGFLNGTKNVQGTGKISKALQGFNSLTPHRMEQNKSIKEGRENQSLRDKEMKLGEDLWNKAPGNKFENLSGVNAEYIKSFKDVADRKADFYKAKDEVEFARANLSAAEQSGDNTAIQNAQARMTTANTSYGKADSRYKLAQDNHEDIKKIHPKDAQKEAAFDLYDKTHGNGGNTPTQTVQTPTQTVQTPSSTVTNQNSPRTSTSSSSYDANEREADLKNNQNTNNDTGVRPSTPPKDDKK